MPQLIPKVKGTPRFLSRRLGLPEVALRKIYRRRQTSSATENTKAQSSNTWPSTWAKAAKKSSRSRHSRYRIETTNNSSCAQNSRPHSRAWSPQKEGELTFPIRWQSYGRFFRYERPQRGRGRSFFQWNIDALGSDSYLADAEIITIACTLFKYLRLTPNTPPSESTTDRPSKI